MPPFNDWIEVFRGGLQTDSAGQSSYWHSDRLDEIVQTYNPSRHEAPLVIGHPEHDSPAWGWVEAVKRDSDKLFVKFKDVAGEFLDLAQRGLFKKRSVAFYPPDHPQNPHPGKWHLRHVGWLGAMPPAVKGLKNVTFGDVPGTSFEFSEINHKQTEESNMKTVEQLQAELDALTARYNEQVNKAQTLEADLKKIQNEKAAGENDAKFNEMKQAADAAKAEVAMLQKKLFEQEESAFCDNLVKEGKLTPAEKEYEVAELVSKRMSKQDVTFGETKTTNYDLHREKLSKRATVIQFGDSGAGKGKGEEKNEDKSVSTKNVIEEIRKKQEGK